MTDYKVEQIKSIDQISGELAAFLLEGAETVAKIRGSKFNPNHFDFLSYARNNKLWICYRGHEPVGALLARLYGSIFDSDVKILFQDLLYVKEGGGRAAWWLLQEFFDFGCANANHIFTTIAPQTNIKPRSLERHGFKKAEELYIFEVPK